MAWYRSGISSLGVLGFFFFLIFTRQPWLQMFEKSRGDEVIQKQLPKISRNLLKDLLKIFMLPQESWVHFAYAFTFPQTSTIDPSQPKIQVQIWVSLRCTCLSLLILKCFPWSHLHPLLHITYSSGSIYQHDLN